MNKAAFVNDGSTTISRIVVSATNNFDVHLVAGKESDTPGKVMSVLSELDGTAKVVPGDQMQDGDKGFEASAITAIAMTRGGGRSVPKEKALVLKANFNRPFGFIVVDRETKLAIFTGWVTESAHESGEDLT